MAVVSACCAALETIAAGELAVAGAFAGELAYQRRQLMASITTAALRAATLASAAAEARYDLDRRIAMACRARRGALPGHHRLYQAVQL